MNTLGKVHTGDELVIGADTWNAMVDSAIYVKTQMGKSGAGKSPGQAPSPSVVIVQNGSGGTIDRFRAVIVTDILTQPVNSPSSTADSQANAEFAQKQITVVGIPTDPDADGSRWYVTADAIGDGQFGRAITCGATPCWVNINDTSDKKVDVTNAGGVVPQSGKTGYDILWCKGTVGTADATGEQWVIVRLGASGGTSQIVLPAPTQEGQVYMANSALVWIAAFPVSHP